MSCTTGSAHAHPSWRVETPPVRRLTRTPTSPGEIVRIGLRAMKPAAAPTSVTRARTRRPRSEPTVSRIPSRVAHAVARTSTPLFRKNAPTDLKKRMLTSAVSRCRLLRHCSERAARSRRRFCGEPRRPRRRRVSRERRRARVGADTRGPSAPGERAVAGPSAAGARTLSRARGFVLLERQASKMPARTVERCGARWRARTRTSPRCGWRRWLRARRSR